MNYIPCQISPLYVIHIREDRYAEFAKQYWFSGLADRDKNMYLYDCIMAGWVKREV